MAVSKTQLSWLTWQRIPTCLSFVHLGWEGDNGSRTPRWSSGAPKWNGSSPTADERKIYIISKINHFKLCPAFFIDGFTDLVLFPLQPVTPTRSSEAQTVEPIAHRVGLWCFSLCVSACILQLNYMCVCVLSAKTVRRGSWWIWTADPRVEVYLHRKG